jgi:diguanylate cyclase (GGDEF)-like protein/PAS domain S-box-containing protein
MNEIMYKAIFDHIKSPVVIADSSGVLDTNIAVLELFGMNTKQDLQSNTQFREIVAKVVTEGRNSWERLETATGKELRVEVAVSPIDAGNSIHLLEFKVFDDSALYEEMSMQAAHTRELFDNSPDSIVIVDNHGRVIDANRSFETVFGYPRFESVGTNIDELVVPLEYREEARELFSKVLGQEKMETYVRRMTKTGNLLDIFAIAYPVVIDRKITGNYVIYKNVSKEKQTEQLLHEKEQFFEQLFNRSLYPIAILDIQDRVLDANPEFERLFGYSRVETIGTCINDLVVPMGYDSEASRFRDTILDKNSMAARTKRRNRNGELMDVEAVGSPVIIDGKVAGMFAMYRDIRVETKALEELRLERAYFRQLFENTPNPVVILDRDDHIIKVNGPFETMFGYRSEEVIGWELNELIIPEAHREEARDFSRRVIEQGKPVLAEVQRIAKDGSLRELDLIAFPIELGENLLGAYVIYQDIADRKKKEREIMVLMNTDPLTGLYNRHYAYQRLGERLAEALAGQGTLSVIYMDLDRFKEINDSLGHQAGDEVLRTFATRMESRFGSALELCRVGGDEFLAMLGGQAENREETCSMAIKSLFDEPLIIDGQAVQTSPSIGWARFPEDGTSIDQLISRADTRMYADKKLRRIALNPERTQVPVEALMKERER